MLKSTELQVGGMWSVLPPDQSVVLPVVFVDVFPPATYGVSSRHTPQFPTKGFDASALRDGGSGVGAVIAADIFFSEIPI